MNSIIKIEDSNVLNIINTLKTIIHGTKFEKTLYLTGEFVCNAILNRNPTQIILAVEMLQGARKLGDFLQSNGYINKKDLRVQGYDVLTFTLKGHEDYEIICSQTRKGLLGPNIKEESMIFGTLKQDALLRGLSINSVYYNISTDKVLDPTNNGLMDIFQKRIRTSGTPYITFMSNPIYMVQAIRTACELGWGIEKNTWLSIVENARRIKNCDMDAFSMELAYILSLEKASIAILKLAYSGLLEYCLPEIDSMSQVYDQKNPETTLLLHTLEVVDKTNHEDLVARFAALLHDYGKLVIGVSPREMDKLGTVSAQFAELTLTELKLGSNFIKKVLTAIRLSDFFDNIPDSVTPSEKVIRKFVRESGESFTSTLDLIQAENTSVSIKRKPHLVHNILTRYEEMLRKEKLLEKPKLPVNGNDIMKHLNIKGEIVGKILDEIEDAFYNDESITKEDCLKIASEYMKALLV